MRKLPKVLFDAERLRYPKTGLGDVCASLVRGLHGFSDIKFYGPHPQLERLGIGPSNVQIWRSWHKYFFPFYNKFEIIHVWHQLSSYFQFVGFNGKKIVTVHDLNCLHEDFLPEKIVKRTLDKIQKNIINADHLVFISEYVREDFMRNKYRFKLKENVKYHVIHNGVEAPKNFDVLSKEDCPEIYSKKFVLNIGVLFPKKNQLSLIRMLPFIKDDLVILSSQIDPTYRREIEETAQKLKVNNRVHIFENVNGELKNKFLNSCEALLHTSVAEGFGIPPVEAMFRGKPVFLSNLTSLPEIGGDFAHYFSDFDGENMAKIYSEGMAKYYNNKQIESNKLRNYAERFSVETMILSYVKLYEKCESE